LASETVRVVCVDKRAYELRHRPWRNEIIAVSPNPSDEVRDKRFSRKLRENLHGTGFGYDSRWQTFKVDGFEQISFAVFSIPPRLRGRHLSAEVMLDTLEARFRQSFREPVVSRSPRATLVAA